MAKTILVVEDDQDSRNTIQAILESMGYTALCFPLGREALAGIKGHKLDLALLDVMMPEMNGYEVLKELRQIPEYKNLPIIMVTAKDEDTSIMEGYKFGADYYITKPFTAKQLQYGINLYLKVD